MRIQNSDRIFSQLRIVAGSQQTAHDRYHSRIVAIYIIYMSLIIQNSLIKHTDIHILTTKCIYIYIHTVQYVKN